MLQSGEQSADIRLGNSANVKSDIEISSLNCTVHRTAHFSCFWPPEGRLPCNYGFFCTYMLEQNLYLTIVKTKKIKNKKLANYWVNRKCLMLFFYFLPLTMVLVGFRRYAFSGINISKFWHFKSSSTFTIFMDEENS